MKFYENSPFFWIWIFYFQKYSESRFWLTKTALFFIYEFCISEKIKWKSVLAAKKAVWGRNTETAGQNYFFVNDKNSWNSTKTAVFSRSKFFISKKIVKVGFGYKNSSFFLLIWILYFRKKKLTKMVFFKEGSMKRQKHNFWFFWGKPVI